jgi:hypothetical protein
VPVSCALTGSKPWHLKNEIYNLIDCFNGDIGNAAGVRKKERKVKDKDKVVIVC